MILGYLSTHESSLRAFACANKNCHIQASPFVYHTFQIELDRDQAPPQIFSNWAQEFRDFSRLQYVKCLVICETQPEADFCSSNARDTRPRYIFLSGTPGNLQGYPRSYGLSSGKRLDSGTQAALESNSVWLPLAHLIPQLPSLLDLLFLLPIQFPECLLDQIHATRPSVRLHIDRFFLRSLGTASTDPYEYILASSPCLFRLRTIHDDGYHPFEEIPSSCYHEDAVARMTSGLASNLREIILVCPLPGASLGQDTPPEWKGFSQESGSKDKRKRGNLRLLRFQHWWQITQHRLDYWSRQTDFTQLRALEFDAFLTSGILRHLAMKFHFPCLKTLVLSNLRKQRETSDDDAEAANGFLRSLPPLMSLTLHGWYPEISIDAFATHHGPRLRELKLLSYPGEELTKDSLQALGRHCIFLQDFTLSLRRSQGDSTEAYLYKALGSLPRLQSVSLDLHTAKSYSPDDIVEDDEGNFFNTAFDDEFDRKIPSELLQPGPDFSEACNGAMREQLINCAIDKTLARSIFDAISSGKPQISLPLEVLALKVTDAREIIGMVDRPAHFVSVLFQLCRPWRISRSIRDDRRHEIQVEETEQIPNRLLPPQTLKSWLEAIWRRVWPEKLSEEWQYSWKSFPISEVV
ncbi:hypothetical protein N7451_012923 [Penicillium sp. IBT 35674x]|nr:hypothetical protein N7451_012923 [Penicillium sp. IBT 35674x]